MLKDETALRRARGVSAALAAMASDERPCPLAADRFDWSSDVLDELARAVSTIGDVVESITGEPDDDLVRRTAELATAIVRRRNELLRDGTPSPRRHPAVTS